MRKVLMRLLRNKRGDVAAEYALIVALIAVPVGLASMVLWPAIALQASIHAIGPDGRAYVCKDKCMFEYYDYCLLAPAANVEDENARAVVVPQPPDLPKRTIPGPKGEMITQTFCPITGQWQ